MNARQQTDLVFIDFSKAFLTQYLTRDYLTSYGVRGPTLHWVLSWLTKRQQEVIVDGETCNPC